MRGFLWVITLSLVLLRVGSADAQQTIDVGTALELARKSNPDLNAARQELEVARGQLVQAEYLSQFNPEIGSSVARRNFADRSGSSTDFDISLSQELEVAGQRGKRIDAAKKNLARVTQQVRNTERVILAQVKASFYRALYSKRRLNLFRRVEELNRRLRDIANSRFRSGDIPKMGVNIAEIRWGQSRKDTIVAERDYRNGLRQLERLSGLEPLGRSSLVGQLTIEPETFQENELLRLASENRPDLEASKLEQKQVEAEIALTRRLIIPNPTIDAFYGQEEGGDKIIGGGLSFPIPLFDRKQGALTKLAGRKSQATFEQRSIELEIQQQVRNAFRSYEAAKKEVEVFKRDVLDQAAENLKLMEEAYRQGKIDLFQVVIVQNDLVNAQFSYLESLWSHWEARTDLERAVGRDL